MLYDSSSQSIQIIDFNHIDLPILYQNLIRKIKRTEISLDTILFSLEEAITVNQKSGIENNWIFAADSDGGYWTFDQQQQVNLILSGTNFPIIMPIDFEQWLKMAYVIQKLDLLQQHYLVTRKLKEDFYASLDQIHPRLASNLPEII